MNVQVEILGCKGEEKKQYGDEVVGGAIYRCAMVQ
jgi:hypothetical protein